MIHRTTPRFWRCYNALPAEVRELADANYELLKNDPGHPSLQLKPIGSFWSVRVGLSYRALGVRDVRRRDTLVVRPSKDRMENPYSPSIQMGERDSRLYGHCAMPWSIVRGDLASW